MDDMGISYAQGGSWGPMRPGTLDNDVDNYTCYRRLAEARQYQQAMAPPHSNVNAMANQALPGYNCVTYDAARDVWVYTDGTGNRVERNATSGVIMIPSTYSVGYAGSVLPLPSAPPMAAPPTPPAQNPEAVEQIAQALDELEWEPRERMAFALYWAETWGQQYDAANLASRIDVWQKYAQDNDMFVDYSGAPYGHGPRLQRGRAHYRAMADMVLAMGPRHTGVVWR